MNILQNLTGDDSLTYRRNRCKCGKDSMFHNGTQQKLTIKIFPKSRPEVRKYFRITFINICIGDIPSVRPNRRVYCKGENTCQFNGELRNIAKSVNVRSSQNHVLQVLVFNETGENEVESIPILYMMHYFNSERSRAEAQIVKALSSVSSKELKILIMNDCAESSRWSKRVQYD